MQVSSAHRIIGILGAMPEEITGILGLISDRTEETIGMRTYHVGFIHGKRVVVAFSRWGKVAAATTVATMIQRYGVTELLFTGVAGGIGTDLHIGDIVLAERLIQHDMDARPIIPRFEVPLLGQSFFYSRHAAKEKVFSCLQDMLEKKSMHEILSEDSIQRFSLHQPKVLIGDIASGDRFFASGDEKENLKKFLPSTACVEMEGAAVAQVCFEHGLPFLVVRIISDTASDDSPADFKSFVRDIATAYSREIIDRVMNIM